jgi:hypothetical protein
MQMSITDTVVALGIEEIREATVVLHGNGKAQRRGSARGVDSHDNILVEKASGEGELLVRDEELFIRATP